jgi:hypothetical protein
LTVRSLPRVETEISTTNTACSAWAYFPTPVVLMTRTSGSGALRRPICKVALTMTFKAGLGESVRKALSIANTTLAFAAPP